MIHISIGQQFSACYSNARLAAQGFSNVFVVDYRNLSSGSGPVVSEANTRPATRPAPGPNKKPLGIWQLSRGSSAVRGGVSRPNQD